MATILLLNFDEEHEARLAAVLRGRGHRVRVADNSQTLPFATQEHRIDLMIVDVTQAKNDSWTELSRLCSLCGGNGLPILILCYSKIYRGPYFELKVEKLGARFVHGG
jgi:DNA-binding response OmpR family regulator